MWAKIGSFHLYWTACIWLTESLFLHRLLVRRTDSRNNTVRICSKIIALHSLWKNRSVQEAERIVAIIHHDEQILSEEVFLIPSGRPLRPVVRYSLNHWSS